MKYEQPYGISDPNAGYINGNPSTGAQGSIPPAAAFEYPMRELVAAITNAGFTPTDNDLAQLTRAIRQGMNFISATMVGGNPNVLQATSVLTLDQYRQGLVLRVLVPAANTGPTSINVDNLGAVTILRGNGAQLSAGDLPGGMIAVLVYDGTYFQIENFQGFTSQTTNNNTYQINLPYVADSGTVNNIVANFNPAITGSLVAGGNGGEILVKLKFAITGPTTITINALAPVSVYRPNGAALQSGDCAANQVLWLIFDGTGYQVANIIPTVYNDLIDTSVSYTVGAGGNFSDLNAAMEYLSKYKITRNGYVTLNLLSGRANYNNQAVITHPNIGGIAIRGATMLGAPDPTNNSYARNGWWNRASDNNVNLSYLRSKFATELNFSGCHGLVFPGGMPDVLDAILLTGDSTSGTYHAGIIVTGRGQGAGVTVPNGLAVWGFSWTGIVTYIGGAANFSGAGPLISIGNNYDGFGSYIGSNLSISCPVLAFGNGNSGGQSDDNAALIFSNNAYAESNMWVGFGCAWNALVHHYGSVFYAANNQQANFSPPYGQTGNVNSAVL